MAKRNSEMSVVSFRLNTKHKEWLNLLLKRLDMSIPKFFISVIENEMNKDKQIEKMECYMGAGI